MERNQTKFIDSLVLEYLQRTETNSSVLFDMNRRPVRHCRLSRYFVFHKHRNLFQYRTFYILKEPLGAFSPKLEAVVQFYLDNEEKTAMADTSQRSLISFRSNESSLLDSSTLESIELSESFASSDESPEENEEGKEKAGQKRTRKASKSDKAILPSNKRVKILESKK